MRGQSQFNEGWGRHQVNAPQQKQPTAKRCINPRAACVGIPTREIFIDQQGRKIESINGVETVIGNTKRNRRIR